ncbi:MAG: FMN-binding negative transcriptional regulator [Telmatospirillum sp.]|nr:FMN-binding negative transcriptional regulator [Telmatospirillum sp.]
MLYRPAVFARDDRDDLVSFIHDHPFATLICPTQDEPWISHVPLVYENGQLFGHLARANPMAKILGSADVQAIFHGPHAYVSPLWYGEGPAVPTWNYAVVHVRGPARLLNDEETVQILEHMASRYEAEGRWSLAAQPANFQASMVRAIVGFSIAALHIEGKFKLSQNRSPDDRRRVADRLAQGSAEDRDTARLMRQQQD